MAVQTQWRTAPNDPRTILGWTLLAIVEESPRALFQTAAVVFSISVILAVLLLLGVPVDFLPLDEKWPVSPRLRRAKGRLADLAPNPSAAPWYPAKIIIRRNGQAIGADEGIVTLSEGWLLVEGCRTSFSALSPQIGNSQTGHVEIHYSADLSAEIQIFDQIGERVGLASEFEIALRRHKLLPQPAGTVCLPPHEIHPWSKGRNWAAVFFGASLIFATILLLPFGFTIAPLAVATGLGGLWWLYRGATRLRNLATLSNGALS